MLALVVGASQCVPAQALSFLSFSSTAARNFNYVRNTTDPTKVSFYTTATPQGDAAGAVAVTVRFASILPNLSKLGDVSADLLIQGGATGSVASTVRNIVKQDGSLGSFSLIYRGKGFSYNGHSFADGANLLSGTFDAGSMWGARGGRTAHLDSAENVAFTSDVMRLRASRADAMAFDLLDMSRSLIHATNAAASSYRSKIGGSVMAVDAPLELAAVPEPASWATMLIGFGLVGLVRRRVTRRHPASA